MQGAMAFVAELQKHQADVEIKALVRVRVCVSVYKSSVCVCVCVLKKLGLRHVTSGVPLTPC